MGGIPKPQSQDNALKTGKKKKKKKAENGSDQKKNEIQEELLERNTE